jgi:rod shape-determining protein MreC
LSSFFRAWYLFLGLGLLTFVFAAFVGRVPLRISSAVALPHNLPYRAGVNLRGTVDALLDRRDLRANVAALELERDELAAENRALELELERLGIILDVREAQAPGVVTTAPVIGASSGPIIDRLEIGSGRSDGLIVNMPVTVPAGLVGLIVDVTEGRALVRTVIDPESRVGVTVRGRGGTGIAAGEVGGLVRVTRFNEADPIEVGDVVETSSVGGFFPRGVQVGVVESILEQDPNDLRRSFLVRPSVDFGTLLEVVLSVPQ